MRLTAKSTLVPFIDFVCINDGQIKHLAKVLKVDRKKLEKCLKNLPSSIKYVQINNKNVERWAKNMDMSEADFIKAVKKKEIYADGDQPLLDFLMNM